VSRHSTSQAAFTVLFVCAGNVCRSAFAERLSVGYLDSALGPEARVFRIVSAGLRALVGARMNSSTAVVLAGFGGVPGDFSARLFIADMAVDADLVLTMTRAQRDVVLSAAPRALSRTFTLTEAADLAAGLDQHPGDPLSSESSPVDAVRDLVRRMAAARAGRPGRQADDISDPVGLPLGAHQEMGEQVAKALMTLFAALLGAMHQHRSLIGPVPAVE
jgi:protein-tyrosine-phosphatase